jgi:hypothetical protein
VILTTAIFSLLDGTLKIHYLHWTRLLPCPQKIPKKDAYRVMELFGKIMKAKPLQRKMLVDMIFKVYSRLVPMPE